MTKPLLLATALVTLATTSSPRAALPILETVSNRERLHVHAELVVTRRLLHSTPVRLLEALPALADIDGAMVVSHGPPEPVQLERAGIGLEGVQQRFSVFPERSGPLVIPEASVRVSARQAARGQVLRVTAPPMAVDVTPMPDSYPSNSAWFPAEDVTLRDEWPAASELAIGQPIDRVLTVVARGAPASTIPPLIARSPDAFRSYPAPAQLDERPDGVVIGERVERRTLIPTDAGAFVVPSVEVVWWNTRTDTLATTIAPVKRLIVTGTAPAANPERPADVAPAEGLPAGGATQEPAGTPNMPRQTLLLAILAAVGWSLALYLAVRQRRNAQQTVQNAKPRRHAAPSLQALLRRLRTQPANETKAAVIDWLGGRWEIDRALALKRLRSTSPGKELLDALNDPIYRQRPNKRKELEPLLRAVLARHEQASTDDALPALYRSQRA